MAHQEKHRQHIEKFKLGIKYDRCQNWGLRELSYQKQRLTLHPTWQRKKKKQSHFASRVYTPWRVHKTNSLERKVHVRLSNWQLQDGDRELHTWIACQMVLAKLTLTSAVMRLLRLQVQHQDQFQSNQNLPPIFSLSGILYLHLLKIQAEAEVVNYDVYTHFLIHDHGTTSKD